MNTQEKEPELGEGVTSAEYWMYDGKLGRRWNMDPIYKFYESPYSCFGNNPNIYIDINGMDTIDVYSQSVDANGKMEGEKGYDKNSMLKLFTVTTDIQSGQIIDPETGIVMGTFEKRFTKKSFEFIAEYSISKTNATHISLGETVGRVQATVIEVNKSAVGFDRAIKTFAVDKLEEWRRLAVNDIKSSFLPLFFDKLNLFNHNSKWDIKSKYFKSPFVYIEGVGLCESDYVGNVFYGSVMRNFQSLENTLNDGDYLQESGIDDVHDSYALIIGNHLGAKSIGIHTFNQNYRITLEKTTTLVTNNFSGFHHDYCISYISVVTGVTYENKISTKN